MDVDELIRTYPRIYHMAEAGSWEAINQHGLLSTSALLDLFEVDGDLRAELESARRPESRTITHPIHGAAWCATRSRCANVRWSGASSA